MGLKEGDLRDTVLSKISIDEFEPKTGESADVIVMGFKVIDKAVGEDLQVFLNNSHLFDGIRDVEVSPNRDADGYFMVFLEVDRSEKTIGFLQEVLADVERVTDKLKWTASTHLTDEFYPFGSDEFMEYFIDNPANYITREEFDQRAADVAAEAKLHEDIFSFLQDSTLEDVSISEGRISMRSVWDSADLEIVAFGRANEVMQQVGIHESAIAPMDYDTQLFNRMLGRMRAIRIAEHIVIFNPNSDTVLITK